MKELIQIWRLIKPKFYNKITWLVVSCGLIMITPPLWSIIVNQFIEKHTDYKIIGDNDTFIGIVLILIGLIYNILSQWTNKIESPENIIDDSTITNSNVFQGGSNMTVNNTFNIYVYNEESLRQVLETIDNSNRGSNVNFLQNTNYISKFINLLQCLPWTKNISQINLQNSLKQRYSVTYKTSSGKEGCFNVRFHNVESDKNQIIVSDENVLLKGEIPILESIFWSKYNMWTLNTLQNFIEDSNLIEIDLENALKNDLSVIVGDITFIIQDMVLELIYDSSITDTNLPSHKVYGSLVKSNLLIDGEMVEILPLEMAIIDSEINTQIIEEKQVETKWVIREKNVNTSILKLSTLIIKVLAKFDRDTSDATTEILRKSILELMKKIKAIHSYQIPVDITDASDYLYNEAFCESSIIKDYEKRKAHNNV